MITLLLNKKIGSDNLALTTNEINTVTLNSDNLNQTIYGKKVDNYITSCSDNDYVILTSNDMISSNDIKVILDNYTSHDVILIECSDSLEIDNLITSDLINLLNEKRILIPNTLCLKSTLLKSMQISDCRNYEEVCLKAIFNIVTNSLNSLIYTDDDINICNLSLDNLIRSRMLRDLIQNANIEDLFPNNNWGAFSKESAAVSYHTLCAMFIKFNDLTTAKECLNLSQAFVDSPRSLALRGLIALEQNDDLGAVANMVSSLQLYEKRKKEINNMEKINSSKDNLNIIEDRLTQGLDALNKRDNHKAATIFADAVYNFDDFFEEQNIKKIN